MSGVWPESLRIEFGLGASYREVVNTEAGLIGWWRFTEGSGDALDSAGSHPGTVSGGVVRQQRTGVTDGGWAYAFDGTGKVSMGDVAAFELTTFSLEAWVRFTSTAVMSIVSKLSSGPNGYALYADNGRIGGIGYTSLGATVFNPISTAPFNDGQWHHCVLAVGVNASVMVDGIQVSQVTPSGSLGGGGTVAFQVGCDQAGADFFAGDIDEPAIYTLELSETVARAHFTAGHWEDVTVDVWETPISWSRGMQGHGPTDRIGEANEFTCDLLNADVNSAGLEGYYSPGHPNCRPGFARDAPARIIATFRENWLGESYVDHTLAQLPAGWWRLNEQGGQVVTDRSGAAHTLTAMPAPPTWGTDGALGDGDTAVTLNGTTQYLDGGHIAGFQFTGDFTVEAWVRFTSTGARIIMGQDDLASRGWGLAVGSGFVAFTGYTDAAVELWNLATTQPSNDDAWHHVAGVRRGGQAELYVDGIQRQTGAVVAGTLGGTTATFKVGAFDSPAQEFFLGDIDEPAIYLTALEAETIARRVALAPTGPLIEMPLFTGRIDSIDPMPGRNQNHRTHVIVKDLMTDLVDADIREVGLQINQTETQLLTTLLNTLPLTIRPPAFDFDAALDTSPYAFHNLGSGMKLLKPIADLTLSSLGYFTVNRYGLPRYENRQHRQTSTSLFSFDDQVSAIKVPTDFESLFTRIRMVVHPKRIDAAATTVLFAIPVASAAQPSTLSIGPGETIERFFDYVNPSNAQEHIAGTAQAALSAGTDYKANAAADDTGTVKTGQVTVTPTNFATTVLMTLSNADAAVVYMAILQQKGKGLYDQSPITVESAGTDPQFEQPITIDLPYQTDPNLAQAFADYLHEQYSQITNPPSAIQFRANLSDTYMRAALTLEVGNRITVSETVTGVGPIDVFVQGIQMTILEGLQMVTTVYLSPAIFSTEFWILEDADSELGVNTFLAFA